MEVLGQQILKAVATKEWKMVKLSRGGPALNLMTYSCLGKQLRDRQVLWSIYYENFVIYQARK